MTPTETPSTYEFLETEVEPACSRNFTLNFPHEKGPFRPACFNVQTDVAPHFTITSIKVGHNDQLASVSCVPATIFSPQLPEDDLYFDLVPSTRNVAIAVTNTSEKPKTFRCRVTGLHNFDRIDPRGRDCLLGLGWNIVEPGKSFVLRVQPQLVLAPGRLHLPPEVAKHFTVRSAEKYHIDRLNQKRNVEIGSRLDAVSPEKLTMGNMIAGGRGFALEPNAILSPNHYLKIEVTNNSAETRPFSGVIVGKQLA